MGRLKEWLKSIPARWHGTRIAEGEQLTTLGVGATFPASEQIAQFYARNEGRPIAVKPLRLVVDNPDTFVRPLEVPEDGYPIG